MTRATELATFLDDAARYFEARPTGGEDRAHWANVYNAQNCREAAKLLRDSGRLPKGEDSRSEAECEASQSGAEGNRPNTSGQPT